MAATGLHDFGDQWYAGPLQAWAEDLHQANLTDFGRRFLRSQAVRDLSRRLRVLEVLRQHPEIESVPIPPIVYVAGIERSGTTLLHNLLAQHRRGRAFLRWELMEPLPPPEAQTYSTDPRISAVQAAVDRMRGSPVEQMHWVNADEPEECVWGFIDACSMLGQAATMCMPRSRRFLVEEDQRPAFENYRRVAQILLWRNGVGADGFLVLKAPQIGVHIAALADVLPEAHFVITDRDPFRCVVSVAVIGHALVDRFCIDNPMTDDGVRDRQVMSWISPKLGALGAFSASSPQRVTHVAYPRLVDDPVSVVQEVFSAAGAPVDVGLADRVGRFLDVQRSGARATPLRDLPTMGYTRENVLSDARVGDYCRTFGIEPELSRLTGAHPVT